MKLEETMFVWTPRRMAEGASKHLSGTVDATRIPEDASLKAHPKPYGASNLDWREMNDDERRDKLRGLVKQLLEEEEISRDSVFAALKKIEDINPNHFID